MAYEPSDENKELLSDLPKTVLLLMACIMLIFLRRSVLEFYYVNSSVRADTVDVFFGPGLSQSFDSINTLNGIWAWLEGPMYDAVKGATEANERRKTLRLSQGIGTLRSNVTLVDNYDNGTYVNTTNYTTYYNLTAKVGDRCLFFFLAPTGMRRCTLTFQRRSPQKRRTRARSGITT